MMSEKRSFLSGSIRTRFAPSPTGQLHLGGARTALFGYLLAKKTGGSFVLRIEDTDQKRFVPESEEGIYRGLEWLGIIPDESPIHGGDFGPYRQSERLEIYQKHAEILLEKGEAYYCFCSSETLEKMRQEQIASKEAPKYNGRCRTLDPNESAARVTSGEKAVIRMKIPFDGETIVEDVIHGLVRFQHKDLDDQVLIKSDGYPTYHLAVVVDDHLMDINLSLRSEEWLPSTPKHLLLYQAFEWASPVFAHLPMVLNQNRSKMSKRKDGDRVWVQSYQQKGYLPEAMVNFLAFLGWNSKTEREFFTMQELIQEFDLSKVNKSGAVFDLKKLNYFNAHYLRKLPLENLVNACLPYLQSKDLLTQVEGVYRTQDGREVSRELITRIVQVEFDRLETFFDIGESTRFFFVENLEYDPDLLVWRKSTREKAYQALQENYRILEKCLDVEFTEKELEQMIFAHIQSQQWGNGDFLWPLRVSLTGQQASPPPFVCLEILGKDESLRRIQTAMQKLS